MTHAKGLVERLEEDADWQIGSERNEIDIDPTTSALLREAATAIRELTDYLAVVDRAFSDLGCPETNTYRKDISKFLSVYQPEDK